MYSFSGNMQSPSPQNLKMNRHVGSSYPSLPPGYQNTSPPGAPRMQSPGLPYQGGPQQFSPVNHHALFKKMLVY